MGGQLDLLETTVVAAHMRALRARGNGGNRHAMIMAFALHRVSFQDGGII